ncbi:MAG: HD domain-containing protein [Verrucomicrobiales bacterium]|nr:HD domain-containing protein [Verrucomicrobiales bacterium]
MKPRIRIDLPPDLARVLRSEPILRRAYLVGGCVRDALLGRPLKDIDVEVFDATYEQLAAALRSHGRVDLVGRSFGVAKVTLGGAVYDFGIPRRDSKTGAGHRGFDIELTPDITPRQAAERRDFTINALMYDPRTCELLDFFGGVEDLCGRVLRHTSPAFDEDPLRVLRGMQFAARFELAVAPETVDRCRRMAGAFAELPAERVREEWFKWASRSLRPSAGIRFLETVGWLDHFPEIAATRGVPQDPEWHPEGDVLEHTLHALDALVRLDAWEPAPESTRIVWALAVLTHDLGKATSTQHVERQGKMRIVSPTHELESTRLAESFLNRIQVPGAVVERVLPLVAWHMAHFEEPSDRAVRRLARRLQPETVQSLGVVMTADASGRPPKPPGVPDSVRALPTAAERLRLADAAPKPLLLGRHLLALGFDPGPEIGRWTQAAFEAQLDGAFGDLPGAHAWLAQQEDFPEPARAAAGRLG